MHVPFVHVLETQSSMSLKNQTWYVTSYLFFKLSLTLQSQMRYGARTISNFVENCQKSKMARALYNFAGAFLAFLSPSFEVLELLTQGIWLAKTLSQRRRTGSASIVRVTHVLLTQFHARQIVRRSGINVRLSYRYLYSIIWCSFESLLMYNIMLTSYDYRETAAQCSCDFFAKQHLSLNFTHVHYVDLIINLVILNVLI